MKDATANAKRIIRAITGLAQEFGDSATLTERIFYTKGRLRLGFFLGSLAWRLTTKVASVSSFPSRLFRRTLTCGCSSMFCMCPMTIRRCES